ncbi:MAG: site-specific DNA-methyltransferase [Smithella sp.]|jgi:DNA modification methylase
MKPDWQTDDGRIQLYRGDCLKIIPEIGKVDAVITDPPYNVGKDYGTHNDSMSAIEYAKWSKARVNSCLKLCKNQFWVAPRYKLELWLSLLPSSHLIVIRRGAAGPNRQGWSDQFEIALAIGKPKYAPKDLWDGIRLKGEGYFFREETYGHPGYTPLLIMQRAILALSEQEDFILDPFMGSGTTGIACIRTGRKFIGIEISPEYFEIVKKRIQIELQRQLLPI